MSGIAFVTDSISCISPELLKEYDIKVVPVGLVIDRQQYKDTELSNDEFWKLFHATKEPITTNAGNPADFEAVFNELAQKTDKIICIPVSKALSATHNMAVKAGDSLMSKNPGVTVKVIDSKTSTGAQGYIVMEAARAARAGKSFEEVVNVAEDMVKRVKFMSAMTTLKYVRRCGRAPKSAFIGDWLNVKPVVGMTNNSGLVENIARERGMDKAIEKMINLVGTYIDATKPIHIFVHYTDDKAMGESIMQTMKSKYQCVETYLTPYSPVMTSQTGPVVAVAFYQ
jgi:DegV family protein with EDD domain